MLTSSVGAPVGLPFCQASVSLPPFNVLFRPYAAVSLLGLSIIPLSRYRNINRFHIDFPFRVRLSPRLTLGRLTCPRNPWAFGVYVSTYIIVTHAYIFFSERSR